jgi:hypothetical protein
MTKKSFAGLLSKLSINFKLIEIRPFFKTGLFLDKAWGHSLYFGHPTDFLRVR